MPSLLASYRVFIASPGGLEHERRVFRDVICAYNEAEAVRRGASFIPVGWEITLGGVGRPQSLINADLRQCDYFVLVLWDRWGTPPSPRTDGSHSSGSEEEYSVAWECFRDPAAPMRQLIAFFKAVDPRQLSDPGAQLTRVLQFRKDIEGRGDILYHTFDEIDVFAHKLRCYLGQWLHDHEHGTTSKVTHPTPLASDVQRSFVFVGRGNGPTALGSHVREASLLEEANRLALEGKLIDAEARYAKAVVSGTSVEPFLQYGTFLARVGRLAQAEVMFRKGLELADNTGQHSLRSTAYVGLGHVARKRGEIEAAEEAFLQAVSIADAHCLKDSLADACGALGTLYRKRGALDKAEEMHLRELAIKKERGLEAQLVTTYAYLGIIAQTRGDLQKAEHYHRECLAVAERYGKPEYTAYGNLGVVYQMRGELDTASDMYQKALDIDQRLGFIEGAARQLTSLGQIAIIQGRLEQGEAQIRKALDLSRQLPFPEGVAWQLACLAEAAIARHRLDEAEALLTEALEIDRRLRRDEAVARRLLMLGQVAGGKGDARRATTLFEEAMTLDERIGRKEGIADAHRGLGLLAEMRQDTDAAESRFKQALKLYQIIGMALKVREVSEQLSRIRNRRDAKERPDGR